MQSQLNIKLWNTVGSILPKSEDGYQSLPLANYFTKFCYLSVCLSVVRSIVSLSLKCYIVLCYCESPLDSKFRSTILVSENPPCGNIYTTGTGDATH